MNEQIARLWEKNQLVDVRKVRSTALVFAGVIEGDTERQQRSVAMEREMALCGGIILDDESVFDREVMGFERIKRGDLRKDAFVESCLDLLAEIAKMSERDILGGLAVAICRPARLLGGLHQSSAIFL